MLYADDPHGIYQYLAGLQQATRAREAKQQWRATHRLAPPGFSYLHMEAERLSLAVSISMERILSAMVEAAHHGKFRMFDPRDQLEILDLSASSIDWDLSDGLAPTAELAAWMLSQPGLARHAYEIEPVPVPAKHVPAPEALGRAILQALVELEFDPQALPMYQSGKQSAARSQVLAKLGCSKSKFKKSWDMLLEEKRIRYMTK